MLFVTDRTWCNWESGKVQVPYAAYKLFRILTGFDLPLYPSRAFKNHCRAIKAVLGVDVSVPRIASTIEECLDADAMTSASEEARQASVVDAQSEA